MASGMGLPLYSLVQFSYLTIYPNTKPSITQPMHMGWTITAVKPSIQKKRLIRSGTATITRIIQLTSIF